MSLHTLDKRLMVSQTQMPEKSEAYYLEEQLSKAFWDNNISGTQDVDL